MMRRRVLVAFTMATGLMIWRHPLSSIRLIRWLDQRSGIDGPSGARVYDALLAPLAGWLYQRVAADVALTLVDHVAPTIVDIGTGPGLLLIAIAARCPTATTRHAPLPTTREMRRYGGARSGSASRLAQSVTARDPPAGASYLGVASFLARF